MTLNRGPSMQHNVQRSVDWKDVRDRIDLAAVATRFLGPAPGRHGDRGRRLWWRCPFHQDRNPSFCVEPGKPWWRCYGCGEHGDAVTLVMRLDGKTYPEAVASLTDGLAPSGKTRHRPESKLSSHSVLSSEAATTLVAVAEARLWTTGGLVGRSYLTGPRRCLTPETARAARLGWANHSDKIPWKPLGIVIPWFNAGRLVRVKVRVHDVWLLRLPMEKRPPKYIEVFRDPALVALYPGPEVIRPGLPLVVTEGEFDALLLGQELSGLAAVVTLGSASARPDHHTLRSMLPASPWYVATDNDPAGDKAAADWPAPTRRVRPPSPFKDWTEARQGGVDLRRFWQDILTGNDRPHLFTWEDLYCLRWGPAVDDPTPGIIIDRPDRGRMTKALNASAEEPGERDAIQAEAREALHPAGLDEALQGLLRRLNVRGIGLDDVLVHPEIVVGTVTGRVTYKEPGLQTVPKDERLRRIGPVVAGRVFVRADYGQIEPRVLLSILRRLGLISWEPGEDLYRDLIADASVDRDTAKRFVNKAINGGRLEPVTAGRLAEFIGATEAYRKSLAAEAKGRGYVETLAGRKIPLEARIRNHGGKAVNRVVQGTAADIFNRAAVAVDRAIWAQGLPAAVAFLLYDELWVEAEPADGRVVPLVQAEMGDAALADGVFVPVRFDGPTPHGTDPTGPPGERLLLDF